MRQKARAATALQKSNLLLTMIGRNFNTAFEKGDFEAALKFVEQAQRLNPNSPIVQADLALCHMRLGRTEMAIDLALGAARAADVSLTALDILSEAYGKKGDLEAVRLWGRRALEKRDRLYGQTKVTPLPKVLPPPPSPQTKERNVIAYSLFGALPKYCETAVINTIVAPEVYPDWTLLFYIDDSVPEHVVARLGENGARIERVGPEMKKWPAPMWRFAAYDLPDLDRVAFRDADAVISPREALSVSEWIASGAAFHHMRDAPSHSELLLAGLWGVVAGSLPPMAQAIARFLAKGVDSAHFADQYFLREYVWPYAKRDLYQNDSIFEAFGAQPFTHGPHSSDFHVGCAQGNQIDISADLPEGAMAKWTIYEKTGPDGAQKHERCHYFGKVTQGVIRSYLPARYVAEFQAAEISIQSAPA